MAASYLFAQRSAIIAQKFYYFDIRMRYVLILLFVTVGSELFSQKRERPVSDYLPTENLEARKDSNTSFNRPRRKKISLIYVESADGILYGNACATSR